MAVKCTIEGVDPVQSAVMVRVILKSYGNRKIEFNILIYIFTLLSFKTGFVSFQCHHTVSESFLRSSVEEINLEYFKGRIINNLIKSRFSAHYCH